MHAVASLLCYFSWNKSLYVEIPVHVFSQCFTSLLFVIRYRSEWMKKKSSSHYCLSFLLLMSAKCLLFDLSFTQKYGVLKSFFHSCCRFLWMNENKYSLRMFALLLQPNVYIVCFILWTLNKENSLRSHNENRWFSLRFKGVFYRLCYMNYLLKNTTNFLNSKYFFWQFLVLKN